MTIGANVAIMAAAAAAQRRQRIVDTFRVHDATARDRARPVAELGVTGDDAFVALVEAGIVRTGRRTDEFWLDEAAYVARRDRRPSPAAKRVVMLGLVALLLLAMGLLLVLRSTPM